VRIGMHRCDDVGKPNPQLRIVQPESRKGGP
jgi:hypothetical protein